MSELGERYVLEVQRVTGGAWGPPSIGGIGEGFESPEAAWNLADIAGTHDADYYRGASWRVVRVTREILSRGESA